MPSSYINGLGQVNHEKAQIYREHGGDPDKTYWVSQIGWQSGKHCFKTRIDKLPAGSLAIGIVTNPKGFVEIDTSKLSSDAFFRDWAFDSKRSGVTYQLYYFNNTGDNEHWSGIEWYFDGFYHHHYGKRMSNRKKKIKWNDNDVIEFIVDCDEWHLSISLNDQQIEGFGLDKYQKYYPAIGFAGGISAVQLQVLKCE